MKLAVQVQRAPGKASGALTESVILSFANEFLGAKRTNPHVSFRNNQDRFGMAEGKNSYPADLAVPCKRLDAKIAKYGLALD
jgi:hypothetical protein